MLFFFLASDIVSLSCPHWQVLMLASVLTKRFLQHPIESPVLKCFMLIQGGCVAEALKWYEIDLKSNILLLGVGYLFFSFSRVIYH
jgi:hypothetical protein